MNKKLRNWVIWKAERRGGKVTKIPYSTLNAPASSTEPTTWGSYEDAVKAAEKFKASGIGFVLPLDDTMIGIDLDKCVVDGKIQNPLFQELVTAAATYTELSPSGTGVHLFFSVPDRLKLERHRSKKCPGFECYSSGRYFTFTGKPFGKKLPIRTMTPAQMNELLSMVGHPWPEAEAPASKGLASFNMSDQEILSRMFTSKNGGKIETLYNGDTSAYGEDDSSADMALCMHLAFWTQKNAERMRTLWLSSPLGSRKKTQSRKDYQDMTISHAIAATGEIYSPTDKDNIVASLDLMVNHKKVPHQNIVNVGRIIEKDELLSASIRYNDFTSEEETNLGTKYHEKEWHAIQKEDISFVTRHIQQNYPYFEKLSKQNVEDAILVHSRENAVNPVRDWLTSLEWDGEHRLNHWLHKTYGVEDNTYHSAVGANWFKGIANRIMRPGCKFDYLLILEGPQGWKKSMSLIVIGNGYHTETVLTPDNKDFQMLLKSNIVVEFSEGHTLNRSDSRLLKSIITAQEDQFRVPFGRAIQKFPRRCVFAMTTNENQYLRDETGNRRFLPVEVRKIADIEWLEAHIEQLYAEAYHRAIIERETYWEFPEEETRSIQKSKMVENPYSDALIDWYMQIGESKRHTGITALEAYQAVWLGNAPMGREMTMFHTMQVTAQLINTLRLFKRRAMIDGKQNNRWFPSAETLKLLDAWEPSEATKAFALL